jgi:hypothetical protein
MFIDLLNEDIQPQRIDANHIPEIEISCGLKKKIQELLEKEEHSFAKMYEKNVVVQTDKNYVFFSNHWLYLAVLCKKYAEALMPYCEFFDRKIRGNQELIKLLIDKKYDAPMLNELFQNTTDKERMIKFIMSDEKFRPGKCMINGSDGSKVRSTKDIFGSCILKKIAVPDASSAYLGNLIYYLANNEDIYEELEKEIKNQMERSDYVLKLPSVVKDCAKEIVDNIYKIDDFHNIEYLFVNTGANIKLNTENMNDSISSGNLLRFMFVLPNSNMYLGDKDSKIRVFLDKEYNIKVEGAIKKCRLTSDWKGSEIVDTGDGNYLKALILIVNKHYKNVIEIKNINGEYYMYKKFKIINLPKEFQTDFARRYITALLSKPFVILTGNSGTGKTRITKRFAKYLEVISKDGEKNYTIVPVGADWTDNSKILGFYNPLGDNGKGKYEKTEIVELIEQANKHENIPYFLILDEMNLSHVERYFSDFLSHMEIPDTPFKMDGYSEVEDGQTEKTGVLKYPKNLFVVGTVNIDETTYMFSPKVLDRANVIEFKPNKDDVLELFKTSMNTDEVKPASDGSAELFMRLAYDIWDGKMELDTDEKRYYGDKEGDTSKTNFEYVSTIFSEIYDILSEGEFEFAYRTAKEVRQYISASYELSDDTEFKMDLNRTIDEQILQKILPKLHGNKKEIGGILEKMGKLCADNGFKLTENKIKQMEGRLAKVQYASFI